MCSLNKPSIHPALQCLCSLFLAAIPFSQAQTEENIIYTSLLETSDFRTYDPFTVNNSVRIHRNGRNISTLSNEELSELADNYHLNQMSAAQRVLNQQWLAQQSNQSEVKIGNNALQKLLQYGFKSYWNKLRQTTFKGNTIIPDAAGKGSFNSETAYQLRLSSSKIKLQVQYSF